MGHASMEFLSAKEDLFLLYSVDDIFCFFSFLLWLLLLMVFLVLSSRCWVRNNRKIGVFRARSRGQIS